MRPRKAVLILTALAFFGGISINVIAQKTETKSIDIEKLLGDWSGESICVDKKKFPACNDEVVVYHIKEVADRANTVNLSAYKIVNRNPDFMGAFDFVYDPKKQTLTGEFRNSRTHIVMEFLVKDDVLDGTMTELPDKSLVRRMKVKKQVAPAQKPKSP